MAIVLSERMQAKLAWKYNGAPLSPVLCTTDIEVFTRENKARASFCRADITRIPTTYATVLEAEGKVAILTEDENEAIDAAQKAGENVFQALAALRAAP